MKRGKEGGKGNTGKKKNEEKKSGSGTNLMINF